MILKCIISIYYIMATKWNLFVKKVFNEGRSKNNAFSFKEALKEASKRKNEMTSSIGNVISSMGKSTKKRRSHRRSSRRSRSYKNKK